MNGPRSIEAVRRATVSVCSVSGVPLGQGLLLSDSVAGPSVLTCHHVATAVPGHKLYVAVPDAAGHLSAPVRAIYDHARSDPSSDLAVLRASVPVPPRPLLHTLAPERYDGGLQQWVTGFTYLSPRTFDALLGIATPLRCAVPEDGRRDVPGGEYRIAHAFRLIESTDTREGISGAPVACDGGVLGLVHFARDASPNSKREGYMIPLANWARAWPELRQWLEPFVDAPLRSTVRVRRARDLTVGMTPQSNSGPDLTIAEYRADVYVRHPAAVRAAGLLDQHGEVLIVGRPMAGKTRLARELLGDRPDAIVVMPEADPPAGRIELAGISDTEIILLCDDIHASLGRVDVARWRRRLAEGGAPVRVLLTCRDGDDWRRIRQADSALAERYRESMVLLSAEEERGSDFPADSSRTLASLLGLSDEALAERFDGTPGSLTVDLAAMRSRYERLREEEVHGVPASRLLDSVKLLYRCNQSPIREQRARQVAEQVRGNVPLSDDTWEALRRRTAAAGFGSFATGIFKGYDPLLEQSVMYEPAEEARLLVGKLLRQGEAWDELLAFGEVPDVEARAREEMLACIEAHAEQDLALIARMRLAFLFAETERTDEVIESFRFVMRSGHPDHAPQAAVALGWHFEHWGRTEEAAIVWQEAIDSGHEVLAPQAAARLGILRSAEGQRDAAAAAYRIAIESGRGEVAGVAAYNLASLLTDFDAEEGLRLLQVAIDSGHAEAAPAAALTLASRQQGARQSQGKTPLLEIGATSPNPALARAAAMQLGLLHADSDDLDGARRVLYPVIESGSPDEATMAAWLLGDALNRNGDAEEAIGLLQIARASTDAERALLSAARLGELLVERGDFDGAADAFRQAMGGSGEVADMATMNLGVVEWRSGNRDSAEDLLGRASRSQFERARAQASAALALIGAWDGEDEQAVAVLSAEIASGDELRAAGASYSLGQLHHRAGRLTQAAEAFRRACSHETEWLSRAQFEFAAVQAALGHVDVAVELLREVVAATRDDKGFESERCHAALNLGVLLREQDDVPATIEPLRIASEACDDDVRAEALLRLGSSLCEIGAQREGLGVLQDAVDTGHERFTAPAAHFLGLELAEKGDWRGAAEAWSHVAAFEDYERWASALLFLARARLRIGQTDDALKAFKRAAESGEHDVAAPAAFELGQILAERGELDDAARWLRIGTSSDRSPTASHALALLGAIERDRGNAEEAVRLWESVLEDPLAPGASVSALYFAAERMDAGDEERARDLLASAIESDIREVRTEAAFVLCTLHLKRGEGLQAYAMLRRAADPERPAQAAEAAWKVGVQLVEENELAQAAEALRLAVDSQHDTFAAAAAMLLGDVEARRGEPASACRFLRLATRSANPEISGRAALSLAAVLAEKEDRDGARSALRLAIKTGTEETRVDAAYELALLLTDEDEESEEALAQWADVLASGHVAYLAEAAFHVGTARISQGKLEAAETLLAQAIASDHEMWSHAAAINLAALKERKGALGEARQMVSELARDTESPLRVRALQTLAVICLKQEDTAGATEAFETVLASEDPEHAPDAGVMLATLSEQAGDLGAAAKALLAPPTAADERFAATALRVGVAMVQADDWDGGAQLVTRVVASDDAEWQPLAALTLGHIREHLGDDAAAVESFELAMRSGDAEHAPQAGLALGTLHIKAGRVREALKAWRVALDSGHKDATPEAAFHTGLAHFDASDPAAAIEQWETAVRSRHPEFAPLAALNLGVLHINASRCDDALRAWQTAVALNHDQYSTEAAQMIGRATADDDT